jgi:hypothetical protein
VEEVKAENSLENKVDQLWQSILIPLFPFDEGYLVVARDRVVNDNKKSADLIVKWLQDDRVVIVFTMSNKRASAKKPMRDEALGQLGDYMELAHTNRTEQGGLPHGSELQGAVGIGTEVSFYDYRQRTRNGPRVPCLIIKLDVVKDQLKVRHRLMEIKRAAIRDATQLEA